MELFDTVGNAAPPEAIVTTVRAEDGVRLRAARWSPRSARGTVVLALGRGEYIEQYFEVIRALLARRFAPVTFEWRGQGQSDRELRSGRRGHVSSFAAYRRDLQAFEAQVLKPFAPRPWFALGHSMGAALLLSQAHDGASPFERLMLTAPMIDVPLRYRQATRLLIEFMNALGLGTWLVPGGSEAAATSRAYADNPLTHDPTQYARLAELARSLPALVVGSPTVRWLSSAFDLMSRFADPRYAVATQMPTLIVAAGQDRIVDPLATERFALRLKAGRCVTLADARHQIMMESEPVLARFWAAFDAFIPGSGDTAAPAPEPAARQGRGLPRSASVPADTGAS